MRTKKNPTAADSPVKIPSAWTLYRQSEWALHDEYDLAYFKQK